MGPTAMASLLGAVDALEAAVAQTLRFVAGMVAKCCAIGSLRCRTVGPWCVQAPHGVKFVGYGVNMSEVWQIFLSATFP